jgi:hypothetical protein
MRYTVEIISDGHNIPIKFHEDWFTYSGNIKVITSKILEAVILELVKKWFS